jgi:dTDP-glucose 4,6-dehydratase
MKKVIIVGSSCHIGQWLVEELNESYEVVGFSRRVVPGGKTITFDLLDEEMPEIVDVDYCIDLAAMTNINECEKNPVRAFNTNVVGTMKILESLKRSGIKKFVYISTGSVYGYSDKVISDDSPMKPENIYAFTKYGVENVCRYYSRYFPVAIARPCFPYGPQTHPERMIARIIRSVKAETPVVLNRDSRPMTNPIYIKDLVKLIRIIMEREARVEEFNLAGPDIVSVEDIARIAAQTLNTAPKFKRIDNLVKDYIIDIGRIVKVLSYSYSYNMREGIKETVKSMA